MSDQAPEPEEPAEEQSPPGLIAVRKVDLFGRPEEVVLTQDEVARWQWGCRDWWPSPPNIPPGRPWTRIV
jgi:hypothetical protein